MFMQNGNTARFSLHTESRNIFFKQIFTPFIKSVLFAIALFPIQTIPDEGHYLSRKQVGSALTETKNWDLLVDCTSRDGTHDF
jgi:hypothetical protein